MVRSANFITIQGLTPNKTYYIRVLAFTSVGDGPLSQDLQIIAKTGGSSRSVFYLTVSLKKRDKKESPLFPPRCSSLPALRVQG